MVEDETGKTVQALLYRGTPDNPAFWPRALQDIPFAAAVMAAATGPSGPNFVYLDRLDQFLEHTATSPTILEQFDDTFRLAALATELRRTHKNLHFLFGCGSNQHNQLLLRSSSTDNSNVAGLVNDGEDAHEMKEIVLCTASRTTQQPEGGRRTNDKDDNACSATTNASATNSTTTLDGDPVVDLFAGGGHSAALTGRGRLYLWGWNESGQLGTSATTRTIAESSSSSSSLLEIAELGAIRVRTAALGFSHTLVIEQETGRLFAFGDNSRGQVNGNAVGGAPSAKIAIASPVTPDGLETEQFVQVAAGLYHSAAVTENGELITFGCDRFGQSLSSSKTKNAGSAFEKWTPEDGSKVIRVACGRRHTVVLDDKGRVWSFGDNKYGQLGRPVAAARFHAGPRI